MPRHVLDDRQDAAGDQAFRRRAAEEGDLFRGYAIGPVADDLVARARQTDARVTVVQDPAALAEVGGVAALLRYRISRRAA